MQLTIHNLELYSHEVTNGTVQKLKNDLEYITADVIAHDLSVHMYICIHCQMSMMRIQI